MKKLINEVDNIVNEMLDGMSQRIPSMCGAWMVSKSWSVRAAPRAR